MTLTFAKTHNMIAYLTKSDASEGFNQIINFLNGSSIKYAITINPNIYVSCIKQFWTSVAVKKVNDVTRLQALVDKKKVVITKASIRDTLCLDDAEGVKCLSNEEIFTELARMGYEKPSTKLTFYKAFFSSQWKFLIHTILQCMSAKRTSWNEFRSSMAPAVIYLSSRRKFNFSKYIFDSLVRNVDSPTKFYMYPRFLQLMIRKQVDDLSSHSTKYTSPALTQKEVGEDDDEVHVEDVNVDDVPAVGVAAKGVVSAADDVVPTTDEEPSIPSLTPPTPPPQPSHDIPSTSKRIEHLELDKIAQALEITKLKQRVKKLKRRNKLKVLKLKRLKRVGSAQRIDTSDDTVMDDEEESEPDELQEVVAVVTTAKIITEVVTAASDTITAASTTITVADVPVHAATTIVTLTLTATPKLEAELNKNIDWDELIDHVQRKQKEDKVVKTCQALKRKPQTEAQARKNMMLYLKNVAGFKMYYFKGMTYDDIYPIFKKHFDSNVAFLQKTKEQMDEEDSRALKRLNESKEEKAARKQS
nr:hypothetical protein [Tanacetum cinerariifolium]